MSTGPAQGVKSSPPIWLWIIMVPLTLAILAGVIVTSLPDDPDAIYAEAEELVASRADRSKIEKHLKRLTAYPEFDARRMYLRARLQANEQRDVKAIATFREAFEIADNDKLKARIQRGLAGSYRNSGQFQESIDAFESSIALDESDATETRFDLARLYAGAGAYTLCMDMLNKVLEEDESHKGARETRGRIYVDMRQYQAGLKDLQQLLLTPGDRAAASPDVVENAAECLLLIGTTDEIKAFIEECRDLIVDPDMRARLLVGLEDYDSVKAIITADHDPLAREDYYRAAVAFGEDDLETASKLAVRACQRMPRDKEILRLAARIFEAANEQELLDVAEANLTRLAELEKSLPDLFAAAGDNVTDFDSRVALADHFIELGDPVAAQRWFATAALVDPKRAPELAETSKKLYAPPSMHAEFPKTDAAEETSDEPKSDEPKPDEPKSDEPKSDEPKPDEPKPDEPKSDEPKSDEPKSDEPKSDEPKSDEPADSESESTD